MIEIMPESEGNVLAIKATEKLTVKDYEEVFIPALNDLIRKFDKCRVLMYLAEGFHGWELGAAWDDAEFGMKHSKDFDKIALAGGPKWVSWCTKLAAHFIKGQVEVYDADKLQEAIAWIKK